MKNISRNDLLKTISENDLKSWQTKKGIPFICQLFENYIEIINSKAKTRRISYEKLDEFIYKFNKHHSPKISDYKNISFDASYLLSIINTHLDGELFDLSTTYFSTIKDNQELLVRSRIFQQLGAKLKNERWAWSGLSHDESYVIFTIWVDKIQSDAKVKLYDYSDENSRNGAIEQIRLIETAMLNKLPVYGLLCEAKDTTLNKRSIKRVEQNDLIHINLEKDGDIVYAHLIDRFPMSNLSNRLDFKNLAVDDLDQDIIGSDSPNRARSQVAFYQRDPRVRKKVILDAKGKCEYCKELGFLKSDGSRYLEAHHIIALSNDGKDKVSNVIALCPSHHKEAHFGANSEELELKFLEIVENRSY